jgi:hypothetical protein
LIPAGGTPIELGVVQSANLDLKVDLKELRGVYRYPIAVADGKGTASGKITFMQLWPAVLASILGGTQGSNSPQAAIGETGTVPSMSTYTITLSNGTTLVAGSEIVVVTVSGSPLFYTRVTSGSEAAATITNQTGGKYSINNTTGVLTFAAGDAGNAVSVTYLYQPATNLNNVSVTLGQVGMNTALTFQATLIGTGKNIYTNQAQQFIVQLNSCLAPSLKLDFKLDDYTGMDLDFQAFIDAQGNLGSFFLINPA